MTETQRTERMIEMFLLDVARYYKSFKGRSTTYKRYAGFMREQAGKQKDNAYKRERDRLIDELKPAVERYVTALLKAHYDLISEHESMMISAIHRIDPLLLRLFRAEIETSFTLYKQGRKYKRYLLKLKYEEELRQEERRLAEQTQLAEDFKEYYRWMREDMENSIREYFIRRNDKHRVGRRCIHLRIDNKLVTVPKKKKRRRIV